MTTTDFDTGASLEIKAHLGHIAARLDADAEERRRIIEIERARVPAFFRIQNNGIIPTPTAAMAINLGGPETGFEWVVRGLAVGGLTWSTTAAGTAEVYITGIGSLGGTSASASSPGSYASVRALSDIVDQASTLPAVKFYGRDQFVVKEGESLVVVILTGTAGQQYVANARAQLVRTAGWRSSSLGI